MKRTEFEAKYWNYYQHIEAKFMNVSSFVYFDKDNFNVYILMNLYRCSKILVRK